MGYTESMGGHADIKDDHVQAARWSQCMVVQLSSKITYLLWRQWARQSVCGCAAIKQDPVHPVGGWWVSAWLGSRGIEKTINQDGGGRQKRINFVTKFLTECARLRNPNHTWSNVDHVSGAIAVCRNVACDFGCIWHPTTFLPYLTQYTSVSLDCRLDLNRLSCSRCCALQNRKRPLFQFARKSCLKRLFPSGSLEWGMYWLGTTYRMLIWHI